MKKIIALLLLTIPFTTLTQNDIETVKETVSKSEIEGQIYFLADDLLKGRATGTPELKIAASYLANTLRSYGVKPNPKTGDYYQSINFKKESRPEGATISLNSIKVSDYVFISSSPIDQNAEGQFLNYGLEDDYKDINVTGKVLVVKAGGPEASDIRSMFRLRRKKQELARKNGAIAIIEILSTTNEIWDNIKHNFNRPRLTLAQSDKDTKEGDTQISHLWALDKNKTIKNALSETPSFSTKLTIGENKEELVTSQNVIGIVEGTDPKLKNQYIIYSAHYDHVGIDTPDKTGDSIYNGARDNAVGTTTVLSMAKNLAKYPTKRSALFILFTGEEEGLLGSSYYVNNPVLPLDKMVYCFNSDNAGYNDTSLISVVGLTRTTAQKNIEDAANAFGLKAIEDPAKEQGLFDRSDNVNFARKGIPAPTFSLGFTGFNGDVTKYYHQPGDEADTLDYDYLLKFFRAYVLSGRYIGNDANVPVWNTGDKYEKASKDLYQVKPVRD